MRSRTTSIKRITLLGLALMLCAFPVMASQGTSTLRGRVLDQLGGLIVGATVTATSADGVTKTAVTNEEGNYVITGLAAGKYIVRVGATGFGPYENTDVTINAMRAETLDVRLVVEGAQENVDVPSTSGSTRVSVDPENNASGLILQGSDLDFLSDDQEQLAADLRALAGPTEGLDGYQLLVDGFAGGKVPPKSSIREVRINADPYTAQQSFFGFGRIEIFTKPGADKLQGQAFFNYSGNSMNARNPFATRPTPFQSNLYGANVSGPMFLKKGSYFLDFSRNEIDENHVVSAFVLDPALRIASFTDVIPIPQRRFSFSGRFDYQLNKDNTFVARYDYSRFNAVIGLGNLALRSRAYSGLFVDHVIQLSETAILSQTVLNETRFQFRRSTNAKDADNSTPGIIVQGAFVGGGSDVGPASRQGNYYQLNNITTWTRNRHTWRAGARLRFLSVTDIAPTNFGGAYIFSSLEQYRDVLSNIPGARPSQFVLGSGDPSASVRQTDLGIFIQDDWRVRPNFTFTYGMRFETQNNVHDKIDFAPRISFAWAPGGASPGKQARYVIRGGFGIFYNRFDEDLTLDARRQDGTRGRQFLIENPDFFPLVPLGDSLSNPSRAQTIRRVASDLKIPYVIGTSLSLERQLSYNTTLSFSYIFKGIRQLTRSRNINAPLPGTFDPSVPGSGVRPHGNIGNIFLFESGGIENDHTLYIAVNSRPNKDLFLFGRIGLSKFDNDVDGPYSFPANSYDLSAEYGPATGDRRVFLSMGANYNTFWGIGINMSMFALSPNRFNITTGSDNNGDGVFTDRPAFARDLNRPGVVRTRFGDFIPNPQPGDEIIPRNFGKGTAVIQATMRVSKTFRFGDMGDSSQGAGANRSSSPKRFGLTFYVLGQNIFNRPNLGPISGNLSSPRFGQSFTITNFPRRLESGVRFSF